MRSTKNNTKKHLAPIQEQVHEHDTALAGLQEVARSFNNVSYYNQAVNEARELQQMTSVRDMPMLDEDCVSLGQRCNTIDSVYSQVASLREMKAEYKKRVGLNDRLVTNEELVSDSSPSSALVQNRFRQQKNNLNVIDDTLDKSSLHE